MNIRDIINGMSGFKIMHVLLPDNYHFAVVGK